MPPTTGSSQVQIVLVLKVGVTSYQLTGTAGDGNMSVDYSRPMEQAIDLGTPKSALVALGQILLGKGGGTELYNDIDTFIQSLPDLLSNIIEAFLNAHIIITKLNITNTKNVGMSFTFQIGLLFPDPPTVAGISLQYFLFQYTRKPSGEHEIKTL